jgi:hypothetical protein
MQNKFPNSTKVTVDTYLGCHRVPLTHFEDARELNTVMSSEYHEFELHVILLLPLLFLSLTKHDFWLQSYIMYRECSFLDEI